MFDSVYECLVAHKSNRPQTFKEIESEVSKSRSSINLELNGLLLRGQVFVVVLYFGSRRVPFYSVRSRVVVGLGRGVIRA